MTLARAPMRTALLLTAFALVGWACSNEEARGAGDGSGRDTGGVTSNLLNSRTDPGVGGSSVPVAGGNGAMLGPPSQELDLSQLGYNAGDSASIVRVVEFSDFGCGYCRQFHLETYPTLEANYMATGKVEWKYVPIVIGMFPNAIEAAETGECAGEQGAFPAMRDHLFEQQPEWKSSDDPMPLMYGYAEEVGLDMPTFRSCIAEGRTRDRIAAGTQLSQQAGVRGTPTFFIVGYQPIPGVIPLELFEQVLDTVHAQALAERDGGATPRP